MSAPFTHASDPRRPMPEHAGARHDGIAAAIASLDREQLRLERLGLDGAVRRCRQQRRYWEFLAALFALEPGLRPARRRAAPVRLTGDR